MVPRLTVVVPTRNRRDGVLALLRALERQTIAPSAFEVVVVVDGSTDGTADAVAAHAAPFALRALARASSGLAATRNAGARAAEGDVVLFLDDDMVPAPSMIAAHLAHHADDSVLGVVGAAPIVVPRDATPVVRYRAAGFARKLERLAGRRDRLLFNDVYGGNFSVRRERFLAAGGYDEEFRAYGHEDYELALRLERLGGRFVYDPEASAEQGYDKTFPELAANVEAEGATAVLFARKHPDALGALTLGKYQRRSRLARLRLAMLAALGWRDPSFRDRIVARVARAERRLAGAGDAALFAEYERALDAIYWTAAERALHAAGAPRRIVAIRDVARWVRAAR